MLKASLLCFLFIASVFASDVLDLTEETFDNTIKENEYVLVEFFAPWCGHCKALAPEYELAATALVDYTPKVKLAKVDCTAHQSVCERFEVRGYPTLKFFKNETPKDYTGPRVSKGIVDWIQTKTGPAVSTLSSNDLLEKFIQSKSVAILAHFDADSQGLKVFLEASETPASEYWGFGLVTFDGKVKKNSIELFRTFDEPIVFDKETFTLQDLLEWANEHAYPYVGEVSSQFERIAGRGLPMGLIFINDEDQDSLNEFLTWATPVAKENYKQMSFAYVGKKFHPRLPSLGASGDVIPTMVILSGANFKWPLDESQPFNKETVLKHIEAVLDGSAQPFFKSEPIPETNDEPVKVVVHKTFDSIVLDETKDVLIEFYAPWCGHCKSLVPVYTELGEHYKDHPTVVIAKMDATANDNTVVQVQGYPTIFLFPAGAKDSPITYEGERDLAGFVDFIESHVNPEYEKAAEEEDSKFEHVNHDEL